MIFCCRQKSPTNLPEVLAIKVKKSANTIIRLFDAFSISAIVDVGFSRNIDEKLIHDEVQSDKFLNFFIPYPDILETVQVVSWSIHFFPNFILHAVSYTNPCQRHNWYPGLETQSQPQSQYIPAAWAKSLSWALIPAPKPKTQLTRGRFFRQLSRSNFYFLYAQKP